jgi:hypothetical protein
MRTRSGTIYTGENGVTHDDHELPGTPAPAEPVVWGNTPPESGESPSPSENQWAPGTAWDSSLSEPSGDDHAGTDRGGPSHLNGADSSVDTADSDTVVPPGAFLHSGEEFFEYTGVPSHSGESEEPELLPHAPLEGIGDELEHADYVVNGETTEIRGIDEPVDDRDDDVEGLVVPHQTVESDAEETEHEGLLNGRTLRRRSSSPDLPDFPGRTLERWNFSVNSIRRSVSADISLVETDTSDHYNETGDEEPSDPALEATVGRAIDGMTVDEKDRVLRRLGNHFGKEHVEAAVTKVSDNNKVNININGEGIDKGKGRAQNESSETDRNQQARTSRRSPPGIHPFETLRERQEREVQRLIHIEKVFIPNWDQIVEHNPDYPRGVELQIRADYAIRKKENEKRSMNTRTL